MNRKSYRLTAKEEELMNLLWSQDKPLTGVEMLAVADEHSWSDNYLPIMLKSLLKKEAIEVCGYVQCGTQYARQFRAAITREAYVARLALGRGLSVSSIPKVAVAMVDELGEDKGTVIQELEEIIKELRES
jgi:predicted transcriptional regulator